MKVRAKFNYGNPDSRLESERKYTVQKGDICTITKVFSKEEQKRVWNNQRHIGDPIVNFINARGATMADGFVHFEPVGLWSTIKYKVLQYLTNRNLY